MFQEQEQRYTYRTGTNYFQKHERQLLVQQFDFLPQSIDHISTTYLWINKRNEKIAQVHDHYSSFLYDGSSNLHDSSTKKFLMRSQLTWVLALPFNEYGSSFSSVGLSGGQELKRESLTLKIK